MALKNLPSVKESTKFRFPELPVCRYSLHTEHEKHIYSKRDFLRIYRDMRILREFSAMLFELCTKGEYFGTAARPIRALHLIPMEEAIAVGKSYCMEKADLLFCASGDLSHVLARALCAIEKMTDRELIAIMKQYFDGEILGPVAERADNSMTVRELAANFFLYGLISELLGKKTGFSRGLDGASIHFAPFGIYPALSPAVPVGGALCRKNGTEKNFTLASLSPADLENGDLWEAMRLTATGAFSAGDEDGALPLLFTATTPLDFEAEEIKHDPEAIRIAAGINAASLHAERVDGTNPMAVIDAVARKKELLERGEGPCFIEFITHAAKENAPTRKALDPLIAYREKLLQSGIVKESELHEIDLSEKRRVCDICALAANDAVSPRLSASEIEALCLPSCENSGRAPSLYPDVMRTKESVSRAMQISMKARFGYDKNGDPIPPAKRYNLADAVFEPLFTRFYDDPTFLCYSGEGDKNGVLKGLEEAIPSHRYFKAPVSDEALLALAAGYAMCGGRAAVTLQSVPHALLSSLGKSHLASGGAAKLPLLIRIPVEKKENDPASLFVGMESLTVIDPVTPADMKGLLTTALEKESPVILIENRALYEIGECFLESGVPAGTYKLPLGKADKKLEGRDLTILSVGTALYQAIEAAERLESKYGMKIELLDARSLVPFDYETVLASVQKTGKLLIVGNMPEKASVLSDIASRIAQFGFDLLDAPPIALGAHPTRPLSATLILDAIHQKLMPLAGYTPETALDTAEKLRLAKLGL